MPIEIRQQNEAELYARAGAAIGAAQKAQKEQEMAFQREQTLLDIQERRRQDQASRDWELQKMLLRSQQDFAQEQRLKQVQLEARARSQEWEVEKMEINSKIDFEKEIQDRQKKINSTSSLLEAVKKARDSGKYPNEQLDALELKYNMELAAIKSGVEINAPFLQPERLTPQEQALKMVMGGGPSAQQLTPITPEMQTQATKEGWTYLKNKMTGEVQQVKSDGVTTMVGTGQWELAQIQPGTPTSVVTPVVKPYQAPATQPAWGTMPEKETQELINSLRSWFKPTPAGEVPVQTPWGVIPEKTKEKLRKKLFEGAIVPKSSFDGFYF
jgi:hypothetical protein